MAQFKFKKDRLTANIERLQTAFRNEDIDFSIFYSVKTNPAAPVLETVKNNNCSFEIVSAYEWQKVKKYKPQELILNGPSKSLALVEDIVQSGVETLYFNIDNDTDVDIVKSMSPQLRRKVKVGLRVYLNRPGIWNRFGFDIESNKVAQIVQELGGALVGLHFHFSTNNFKLENYTEMLKAVNALVERHGLHLTYVDIGGGLPGASDILFSQIIYTQLPEVVKAGLSKKVRVFSEVGRNLVEDVFDLETTVVSIKSSDAESMDIVIDTNIMHFPCFWEKKYDIEHVPAGERSGATVVNIFGNSCMQIDKIAEDFLLAAMPQVGDLVTLTKMGAYSLAQASNFITEIPAVVV